MAREFPQNRQGSTIVESCIVMILLCLILFGILQVSMVTAAHDVFLYSASAGARCATVGYNDGMIEKTVRIAALPTLGPRKISTGEELMRVRNYMSYEQQPDSKVLLSHITDTYWNSFDGAKASKSSGLVTMSVMQRYPMTFPFVRHFYNRNYTEFSTDSMDDDMDVVLEDHAALYLYD